MAIASLVLGILSLIVWLLPWIGVPVSVCGLTFGILRARGAAGRGMAQAGLFLSAAGLLLTVGAAILEFLRAESIS